MAVVPYVAVRSVLPYAGRELARRVPGYVSRINPRRVLYGTAVGDVAMHAVDSAYDFGRRLWNSIPARQPSFEGGPPPAKRNPSVQPVERNSKAERWHRLYHSMGDAPSRVTYSEAQPKYILDPTVRVRRRFRRIPRSRRSRYSRRRRTSYRRGRYHRR